MSNKKLTNLRSDLCFFNLSTCIFNEENRSVI